ncbi:MAG TPA: hypothetical protein VGP72_03795 [Planctomycetota bacterium]|jgi:hypothetical protein
MITDGPDYEQPLRPETARIVDHVIYDCVSKLDVVVRNDRGSAIDCYPQTLRELFERRLMQRVWRRKDERRAAAEKAAWEKAEAQKFVRRVAPCSAGEHLLRMCMEDLPCEAQQPTRQQSISSPDSP